MKRFRSIVVLFSGLLLILLASNVFFIIKASRAANRAASQHFTSSPCSLAIIRLADAHDKYTRPLLLAESESESEAFSSLKADIAAFIEQAENTGMITAASVYVKDMNSGFWTSMFGNHDYHPGSLMKLPILLYYLKQEELHPGTLKKEFVYEKASISFPTQKYKGDSIIPGRKYPVARLLRYMIDESDNNATYLLNCHMDTSQYREFFKDIDIPYYEPGDLVYSISPRQYSKFFRLLYNATFVNEELSEYGLKLLTESSFREGLVKELPEGTVVAHKFGERGINGVMDFSESGIIYAHNSPYILTIMTRGNHIEKQTAFVSGISAMIYKRLGGK
ncbi:MAG: serine hydrolase [Bacteroidota bacterium]